MRHDFRRPQNNVRNHQGQLKQAARGCKPAGRLLYVLLINEVVQRNLILFFINVIQTRIVVASFFLV